MQQLEESEVDLLAVVEQYEVGNKALLTTFRQSREADAKQIHERMEEMEMGYVSSLERELAGLRKQQIASDMEQKSRRELCSPTK